MAPSQAPGKGKSSQQWINQLRFSSDMLMVKANQAVEKGNNPSGGAPSLSVALLQQQQIYRYSAVFLLLATLNGSQCSVIKSNMLCHQSLSSAGYQPLNRVTGCIPRT